MKHLALFINMFVLFGFVVCNAQTKFQPTGDFTSAMNINILDVKVNGVDLVAGDEVGIFDGDLCVGVVVLQKNLEETLDAITQSAVAGADDSETGEKDGFISGDTIAFKIWDKSEDQLIDIDSVKFYNPKNGSEIAPRNFEIGATVYVSLSGNFNYIPKSDAGFDIQLYEGESGQLDGSGSYDLDQSSLVYSWSDLDTLGLINSNEISPSFTAPQVEANKDYRVVLEVNDAENISSPDTVVVTVLNVTSGPVADAGLGPVVIAEKDTLMLDGTNSFDPDGLVLSWQWTISDNRTELINSDSAIAKLVTPELTTDTAVYAVLKVTNSSGYSAYDTLHITILNINVPPVAVASSKAEINEGEQISLEGSNSYDPDNAPSGLTYQWLSLNEGVLSDTENENAVFTAPWLLADSTFLFTLTVFDGEDYSTPDTIAITVLHSNLSPVASAGANLIVNEGDVAVLDGSMSFDPEGDTLVFKWNSDYFVLDDVFAEQPTLSTYEIHRDTMAFVTLKVSDGDLWSEPDTIKITVKQLNKSPEWISLPEDTAFLGQSYAGLIEVYDPDLYDTLTILGINLPDWLNLTDQGNGKAELIADSIPHEENILGDWNINIFASDGNSTIDTVFSIHISVLTSVLELKLSTISVYPNPAHEKVSIKFQDPVSSKETLLIFDAFGKLILQKNIENQIEYLNVRGFSKGMYIIQVVENARIRKSTKVLIN
ncbi:T9SS type A sorting domain-containing protein [Draconibacterium sp. IB214405]|uniref:PKD domain-containing protein n=1 Tax=Draconibacterium sp. IB214405 TaxID=3097352 RepID=UPI002A1450B7|nr:T9SS type A sorting domain-containing protein [Draconibacterium sp. IB214405]MDX8339272.1 T9SS type A sorting domain-containing protein [Draconibacterium sp. IB214405]